jgi:hypothetical protein
MFAAAYMGGKLCFSNAFALFPGRFAPGECRAHVIKALEGAAPRRFRPTYARANVGHPSKEIAVFLQTLIFADEETHWVAAEQSA